MHCTGTQTPNGATRMRQVTYKTHRAEQHMPPEIVNLFLSEAAGPTLFFTKAEPAALVSTSPTREPSAFLNKGSSRPWPPGKPEADGAWKR